MLALVSSLVFATLVQTWPMVGWDAYRKYEFYMLRPDDVTREFSSYDRTGGNNDGFYGTYSCLYNITGNRCVIADAEGPGQISDIWFTFANDSVIGVGDIQIELDGQIVVEGIVQDIVEGSLGSPFVWPLVGDVNDTSGGNVIKVPMPYEKSMRISTSKNPHFYHVYYRTFPDDVKVETFNSNEDARDVVDAMSAFGVKDPKGAAYCNTARNKKTASYSEPLEISGTGLVDEIQIRIPEILGASIATDDGRAFGKGGSSTFTMNVDGSASQCSLTRRLDRTIGNQKAAVKVDGQQTGYWEPLPSENATWYNQILNFDASLTVGKSSITIENTFVSSDKDFNEFYYAAHCRNSDASDWKLTDLLNVGWNNLHDEAAHNYQIVGQTWEGLRKWYTYAGKQGSEAQQSIDALNDIYIQMEFDGHETVNQPLGSFFGVALGKFEVRNLMLSVDPFVHNGGFTSWFPMPFSKSFKLGIVRSGSPVTGTVSVDWHEDESFSTNDQSGTNAWGYFSTQHRRAETKYGELWPFLSKSGSGVAYGVTHAIRGSILPPNNTLWFLEGDFRTWYNRTTPGPFDSAALQGTGTEDFYESGWYFADSQADQYGTTAVPYSMPLCGLTGSEFEKLDCIGECVSPMRILVPESLAFDDGISMNIEHGPIDDNVNANYETTAFYYAPIS